jgi:hypothetical protein
VLGREVGVEEADRQRLDPVALQCLGQRAERGLVEPRPLPTGAIDALFDLEAPFARYQRWLAMEAQVERLGPIAASDLEDVAKALGGEQGGAGAGALQQRVDDERRAVLDESRAPRLELRLANAVENRLAQLPIRRRAFGVGDCAGFDIAGRKIGKGSADIDGDDIGHGGEISFGGGATAHPDWIDSGCALASLSGACPFSENRFPLFRDMR